MHGFGAGDDMISVNFIHMLQGAVQIDVFPPHSSLLLRLNRRAFLSDYLGGTLDEGRH